MANVTSDSGIMSEKLAVCLLQKSSSQRNARKTYEQRQQNESWWCQLCKHGTFRKNDVLLGRETLDIVKLLLFLICRCISTKSDATTQTSYMFQSRLKSSALWHFRSNPFLFFHRFGYRLDVASTTHYMRKAPPHRNSHLLSKSQPCPGAPQTQVRSTSSVK